MKGCLLIIITQLMIGLVISLCKDYGYPTNATYGDLAGKTQYLRYMGIDLPEGNKTNTVTDGILVNIERIGDTNDYNHTSRIVYKSRNVKPTKAVYTVDDTTHSLLDDGRPQKYYMISYKPDSYALMYVCVENPAFPTGSMTARLLFTTNLTNDVSQALEEDKKYNFVNALVELPFNHKDLYENEI